MINQDTAVFSKAKEASMSNTALAVQNIQLPAHLAGGNAGELLAESIRRVCNEESISAMFL